MTTLMKNQKKSKTTIIMEQGEYYTAYMHSYIVQLADELRWQVWMIRDMSIHFSVCRCNNLHKKLPMSNFNLYAALKTEFNNQYQNTLAEMNVNQKFKETKK